MSVYITNSPQYMNIIIQNPTQSGVVCALVIEGKQAIEGFISGRTRARGRRSRCTHRAMFVGIMRYDGYYYARGVICMYARYSFPVLR